MINPPNRIKRIMVKARRNATLVMAGYFDPPSERAALTSLLNGVGPNLAVEKSDEDRAKRKREREAKGKKQRGTKGKNHTPGELQDAMGGMSQNATTSISLTSNLPRPQPPRVASSSMAHEFKARPTILLPAQRSVSVTPSPTSSHFNSTPGSTPGPSNSSSTSRTSSKRPRTPDDDDDIYGPHSDSMPSSSVLPQRRKRQAVKKGWKGWVEGSPPPSEKLINLDAVPVLQERRTRSGKNFDAY